MTIWQYAQLAIDIDEYRLNGDPPILLTWAGPDRQADEMELPTDHVVADLLNHVGNAGWELVAVQHQETGGSSGVAYRDPLRAHTTYTFKRPHSMHQGRQVTDSSVLPLPRL